jgi:hypothetical protein
MLTFILFSADIVNFPWLMRFLGKEFPFRGKESSPSIFMQIKTSLYFLGEGEKETVEKESQRVPLALL